MKRSAVKVSVIIPVYNSEEYLKKCLDSLVAQSLQEIEIIVVDDGSTDGSWQLIESLANKDNRIVPVRQRNKGVSVARNTGLQQASGEYVGFVDSDDFVDPDYFKNLYHTGKQQEADIVSGYVDTENERRRYFYNHNNKIAVERNKCLLMGVVWLNIYKNSMLKKHDVQFPSKLRTAEDNVFNLQASYYANKVVSVIDDTVVYHQVTREGSLTAQQYTEKNLLQLSRAIFETTKLLNSLENYSQEAYELRIIDTLNYFYERFKETSAISNYARRKISTTFIRIWRMVQHKQRLLELIKKKEIDLATLMHGRYAMRLYEDHVLQIKRKESQMSKLFNKRAIKQLPKRTAKAILPHGFVVLYKRRLEVLSKVAVSGGKESIDSNKVAIIVPFQNVKYAELLKQAVEHAGYEVTTNPSNARYVWLHWYENGINNYADFLNKLSAIKTWREQGRKVILHVHNKKPHESPVPNISHALMTTLVDTADRVVIMSTETKSVLKDMWYYDDDFSKVSLVPHPNYIDAYGARHTAPASLKDDTLKILFFGLVRPYKGIENLLQATDGLKNVEISIFGNPKDDAYVEKIKGLCAGRDNVNFRLEFIPDEDIPEIFASHHVIALPYSIESSLNSGAAILALSYARTIIGTNNGTLKDIGDSSLYFGYDYKDEQDHVKQLKKTIQAVQAKYDGHYNELLKVGDKAYQLIKKENGIEKVADAVKDMVRSIG